MIVRSIFLLPFTVNSDKIKLSFAYNDRICFYCQFRFRFRFVYFVQSCRNVGIPEKSILRLRPRTNVRTSLVEVSFVGSPSMLVTIVHHSFLLLLIFLGKIEKKQKSTFHFTHRQCLICHFLRQLLLQNSGNLYEQHYYFCGRMDDGEVHVYFVTVNFTGRSSNDAGTQQNSTMI